MKKIDRCISLWLMFYYQLTSGICSSLQMLPSKKHTTVFVLCICVAIRDVILNKMFPVYVNLCVCVYEYVCMYVYVSMCMSVCMYVCVCLPKDRSDNPHRTMSITLSPRSYISLQPDVYHREDIYIWSIPPLPSPPPPNVSAFLVKQTNSTHIQNGLYKCNIFTDKTWRSLSSLSCAVTSTWLFVLFYFWW